MTSVPEGYQKQLRQLRIWNWVITSALILLAAFVAARWPASGQGYPAELTVTAADGRSAVSLSALPEGDAALMTHQDKEEQTGLRAGLGVVGGRALIRLSDQTSDAQVELGLEPSGIPYITLTDATEKGRIAMTLVKSVPLLRFHDRDGNARMALGLRKEGSPFSTMRNQQGDTVYELPLTE